jgi:dipeptidyl aminopeptidase/acylaminoacyl peptidase
MKRMLVLALAVGGGWRPAAAQANGDTLLTVERYLDLEQVGDPQISPDGKQIVYTRSHIDKVNDRWESELWLVDPDGTRNRFLVKGSSPTWSPDGTRIAYVAAAESPKGAQIFVRYMDAEGATIQVTRLTEGPNSVKWSPDGKWLGFSKFVPKANAASVTIEMPAAPPNAKWSPGPKVVEKLHYRMDRAGYSEPGYYHLFMVPADGGTARQLTSGEWSVGAAFDGLVFGVSYDWAPNGKTIYFEGLNDAQADLNYRDVYLYALDLGSLALKQLTTQRGHWTSPSVSPDGNKIAYAGYAYTPQTYRVADLYVMNIDGSGSRQIASGLDRDASSFFGSLRWATDGSGLYLSPEDKGSINIVFAPVGGGAVKPITTGAQTLGLSSASKGGIMVGVRSTADKPGDVVKVTVGPKGAEVQQLTNVNEDLLAGKRLAQIEEIWYPSTGGARIQGWIVKPPSFNRSKKYPLLLEIHGGPHGMYNVGFDYMWQTWAANGFVVLYTNPRGSTGYGTAFGNAIDQAYPSVDYDDLMAGVDTVIGRGYVDEKLLFVSGCSGGGVLSSWVIGHTTRFAGAAVRCPVTNWISMMGQTDIPLFGYNFFGKPFWEDPTQWLKQSSLMYVGNVTTPTMLMTGELDLRTPIPQSEEYYSALKMRGIPTAMLRFQGEWHGTQSLPSNWMRTQLYMMSWFKKYGGRPTS